MKKQNSQGKKREAVSHGTSSKQVRTRRGKSVGGKRIEHFQEVDDRDDFWARERKRQKIQVKLEDGKLLITLPLIDPPQRSRSGKSHLVASTGGVKQTPLLVKGVPVHVVATAFIYLDWMPAVKWVPLIEPPKSEDDGDDEDEDAREWATVPLLE
jgi:hypothetical protein